MAVWSMLSAPLLAGTDLARATPATLALLGNRALSRSTRTPRPGPRRWTSTPPPAGWS